MDIIKNDELGIFYDLLNKRNRITDSKYLPIVKEIINNIKEKKDEALFKYINDFDSILINKDNFIINREQMKEAYERLNNEIKNVFKLAYQRIYNFHIKEKSKSWFYEEKNGEFLGIKVTPIENVGIYVPGGKASYPSTIFMCAIPAIIAGVENIYMATPSKTLELSDNLLAAAYLCNVKQIYLMGGAQAIGALTYGTESVTKVDKIVGPGNIFVALAKKEVFGEVSIDSIAGPSEILIIADNKANPKYVAADLLSQAEHDELASAILITQSRDFATQVNEYIDKYKTVSPRKSIIDKSINNYGRIIITNSIKESCDIANEIAPEHLELLIENPFDYINNIKNAGCIFMGYFSPEALGDYLAGSNHVLPTNKTARFFSPLGVSDFEKKSSIVYYSKKAFLSLSKSIQTFAKEEGLYAHAYSAEVRESD